MKYLYCTILLLATRLPAQTTKINQDPGVDWAAYIDLTLPADPFFLPEEEGQDAAVAVLKLTKDDNKIKLSNFYSFSLNEMLWEMAKTRQWEMYSDPELTKPMTVEDYLWKAEGRDTTITFDSVTYEEKVSINLCIDHWFPYQAQRVKVRQLLIYHNTSARFEVQTLAIAPCWVDGKVPYWLKVPAAPANPPRPFSAQKNVTWAMRYTTEDASPSKKEWTEIKNTTGDLLKRFADRIRTDTAIHLYDRDEVIVPPQKRACLFSCTDSSVIFDPQTWIEHKEIKHTGLDFEEFEQLQLIEEWCWLEDEHRLYTRLIAVAPFTWISFAGEPLNRQPKFYRRCDE